MELLSRKSVDEDYAGRCPAQALRAGSSGSSADGTVFLLAGSGKDGLAPARRGWNGNRILYRLGRGPEPARFLSRAFARSLLRLG
jgi:hypothetical protein